MQDDPRQELTTIWNGVREELRGTLPQSAFENWLEPLRAVGIQGTRLYVSGPDRVRDWFRRRYGAAATAALRRRAPGFTEIAFADPPPGVATADAPPDPTGPVPSGLAADLDFDHFVIGGGNRFAHSAALAVAESPGESYNPLFLYGSPGLGKTHLLVSIANYLQSRRPDLDVAYTTAERFTSEFVTALRGDGRPTERFKQRYRGVDVLLIDDVQFLEGKARTEDEFFHTFNELYAQGSQIVLSSDRPPEALGRLSERMRDRFAWGLTVEVQGPDPATRVTLLRRLAAEHGIPVPDLEVLQQIATAAPANLRRLEGALTRVTAFASMLGEQPTADLVRKALGDAAAAPVSSPEQPPGGEQLERIQRATCEVLRLSLADMRSPRRAPNLVRGRQLAMYVARNRTDLTLAEIARGFERDHSTVVHSIRRVERDLEPGSDTHRALERIHERLHNAGEGA
ncbi:MAG TPA: chromosomal replication initiator protein DnaA [Solirubrobacterales bacterium]|nr:chromosomal replication initiator protein DnaA [Solirubrobacterales bacterium]